MDKTFDAATAEPRLYAAWESAGAFRAGANASRDETFCIMIPPPNVTGALHMGHAFNNTLQDILVRWHRMRGFDTLWQPGQDHAGIATQLQVEKQLALEGNVSRAEMGREEFLKKVWEWKGRYGSTIIDQLKRLGASCDWERNAFTMAGAPGDPRTGHENSPDFHDAVLKVFVDLYKKGLIYRGKRLVNWDPHFETAISDLEVENIEVDGHMWHFKYPLQDGETYTYIEKDADGNIVLEEERDYISIATTRPETMLGDGAVAVHPSDERYAPIVGKFCEIPVGPKEHRRLIPIITDDYPDPDFGSGAVKITGAHDFNDYGVASRNNIPMYRLMDTAGRMRDDGAPYAQAAARAAEIAAGADWNGEEVDTLNLVPEAYRGMDRFEARRAVVADIDAEGLMIAVEDKKIMQPFCDRSKVVMEPMLTDQWYVDAEKLAGPALDAVRDGRVEILPERDKKVYFHWLENIEPWCISRQLWWGHQIPVWYGLDLGSDGSYRNGDELDHVQLLGLLTDGGMVHAGEVRHCAADFDTVAASFREEILDLPQPLSHAAIVEVEDKPAAIRRLAESLAAYAVDGDPTHLVYPVWRDPDVLDTWFSSGLWPIGTLGWPANTPELKRYFPTSVLVTGFDILFFWVARMMMMQLEVVRQVPFRTVYLHSLVRDERGVKMSKTLGNVVDPLDLIDEFGADAVRFTMTSMAALGGTLKLSTERVRGYRNFTTKLWNAARFAEMNGVFGATDGSVPRPEATLNRWIVGEIAKTREAVDAALDGYRFNEAAGALYSFVWGTFCDWYLEFSKPLLFSDDEAARSETCETMAWALDQVLILLHPIMPFITEELWQASGQRAKMLVHADWPEYTAADLVDADADREINWVIGLIEAIRSTRAQMHVPAGAKVPLVRVELDAAGAAAWQRNTAMIERLARLGEVSEADTVPGGAATIAVPGGLFALPLEGVIDVVAEKARLKKTIDKLAKDIGGLRGRLDNPRFVASAPEDVVEETREQLAAKDEELGKLNEAYARLDAIG